MTRAMLNRVAVVLVVLLLLRGVLTGLMIGNLFGAVMSGIGAAAFACNWPLDVSRPIRIVAFVVQLLTVVSMAGMLFMLLSIADAGTTGWEEVPWWFWLGVAAVAFIAYRATLQGYVLLRDDR